MALFFANRCTRIDECRESRDGRERCAANSQPFNKNLRKSGAVIPLLRSIHPESDRLLAYPAKSTDNYGLSFDKRVITIG
jgi:hypothetical protein